MKLIKNPVEMKSNYIRVLKNPESPISERYRELCTRIERFNKDKKFKIIGITSSIQGEGKTITSINLSLAMASYGKRVLLMEGDLRHPSIKGYLNISDDGEKQGIIEVLEKDLPIESVLFNNIMNNFYYLSAGKLEGKNSSVILDSNKMRELIQRLRAKFDYIFVDSPPILALADVNVISTLVDYLLIVIKAGGTRKELVTKAIDSISKGKILGIVLNEVDSNYTPAKYYGQYY